MKGVSSTVAMSASAHSKLMLIHARCSSRNPTFELGERPAPHASSWRRSARDATGAGRSSAQLVVKEGDEAVEGVAVAEAHRLEKLRDFAGTPIQVGIHHTTEAEVMETTVIL